MYQLNSTISVTCMYMFVVYMTLMNIVTFIPAGWEHSSGHVSVWHRALAPPHVTWAMTSRVTDVTMTLTSPWHWLPFCFVHIPQLYRTFYYPSHGVKLFISGFYNMQGSDNNKKTEVRSEALFCVAFAAGPCEHVRHWCRWKTIEEYVVNKRVTVCHWYTVKSGFKELIGTMKIWAL